MTDKDPLLPCPFCGPGQSMVDPWFDDVSKRWAVGCGRCGASSGRSIHAEGSKEAAIRSWNTRAPAAAVTPHDGKEQP
jgi:Lar family restriction alleviation protein